MSEEVAEVESGKNFVVRIAEERLIDMKLDLSCPFLLACHSLAQIKHQTKCYYHMSYASRLSLSCSIEGLASSEGFYIRQNGVAVY